MKKKPSSKINEQRNSLKHNSQTTERHARDDEETRTWRRERTGGERHKTNEGTS